MDIKAKMVPFQIIQNVTTVKSTLLVTSLVFKKAIFQIS